MSTECPDTSDDDPFPTGVGENQMAFIYLGNADVQISAKWGGGGGLGGKTEELERGRDKDEKAFLAPRWQ